jgi:hypothetical protein
MGSSSSKESAAEKAERSEKVEKPEPVDLRDHEALKGALDVYSIELIKKAGYAIDHTLDDVVCVISVVAILLALLAHFWEKISPANKGAPMVIVPCVVGYFAITGIVTYITSYASKGIIMRTKPSSGMPALKLKSVMKASVDDHYTLTLTMGQEKCTRKEFIGNLFDEDGVIQLKALSVIVNDLLHEMDAPSESSNGDSKKEQ